MRRKAPVPFGKGLTLCPEFSRAEGSSPGTPGFPGLFASLCPWVRGQLGCCCSAGVRRSFRAAVLYRMAVVSSSPKTTANGADDVVAQGEQGGDGACWLCG